MQEQQPLLQKREDMENSIDPEKLNQETSAKRGGFKTMPFIIANESFERVASYGLLPNMIKYLMGSYHMDVATGSILLTLWGAATNFLPVLGAFVSDSYLGRYRTIVAGCIASLMGMVLLWVTAMIPQAKPPKCVAFSPSCESATPSQLTLLYASFVLMSIGAGGIRPCSLAFGADQLNKGYTPDRYKRVLQSFFNWYYASSTLSVLIALTAIVYVQDHLGWKIGFGIPAILMFLSAFLFLCASSLYVKAKPNKSLFVGFAQVSVAAIKNRHIALPPKIEEGCYHHIEGSNMVVPSDKLRFLNRACMIQNPENDLNSDGSASNPWRLCTVEQVEELKAMLKVIPLWSTGIMIAVNISQPTFPYLQTSSMNRHLTSKFQIPAGSFGMFTIITLVIWIPIYDRLLIPQLAKITGKPYGLGLKQRMGIGLLLSCIGMGVSASVETIRRRTAIEQGLADNPQGIVNMSAMWLIPQNCLGGVAEAFNAIGQVEFFYSQFPKSMSSIATALFGLGMAFGSLLAGLIIRIVDDVTKAGGKVSWVSSNLNRGRYDYYYWLLTGLGAINIIYFLFCCWLYGPCEGERTRNQNEDEDMQGKETEKSKDERTKVQNEDEGMKGKEQEKSKEETATIQNEDERMKEEEPEKSKEVTARIQNEDEGMKGKEQEKSKEETATIQNEDEGMKEEEPEKSKEVTARIQNEDEDIKGEELEKSKEETTRIQNGDEGIKGKKAEKFEE